MTLQAGDTVGTYRVVARLGSGAAGEVFQVEHLVTRRTEALKILTVEAASLPEQVDRFQREIQLQAGLNHPNIAAVHHAFRENGHLVMIMELIQGRSLRNLLEDGRLHLHQSIDYALQALAALDYAHARGVVHRDISPSNMIVTEDGTLKLTDFGLAKSARDLRLTQTGEVIGSLYYISPEQVRGDKEADSRSDIYSLGAVLYEMVTGVKPFFSDSPFMVMQAHVEETPRRPSELDNSLPAVLDDVVLRALEKNPEKRFPSAAVFRQTLDHLLPELAPTNCSAAPESVPTLRANCAASVQAMPYYWLTIAAVAAGLVLALTVRGTHLPEFAALQNPAEASQSAQLTALPFYWSADLIPVERLKYRSQHRTPTHKSISGTNRDRVQKHSSFVRAMNCVVHLFHHTSEVPQVSDETRN